LVSFGLSISSKSKKVIDVVGMAVNRVFLTV
jgi:hypothetical protein